MSKNSSNLFVGTKGARLAKAITPSVQRSLVRSWAEKEALRLEKISKRQREKFKTACVAVDENTGRFYYGKNGGINRNGDDLHPILKTLLPSNSLNGYPTPWNCAESHAINQALHAGANISNLHIYTIGTTKNDFGSDKVSCANCTAAYKGKVRRNNTGWIN